MLGVEFWIEPVQMAFVGSVGSGAFGRCIQPLPIPQAPALVGARDFAQFLWYGPSTPPPCPPLALSATNGLEATIQR